MHCARCTKIDLFFLHIEQPNMKEKRPYSFENTNFFLCFCHSPLPSKRDGSGKKRAVSPPKREESDAFFFVFGLSKADEICRGKCSSAPSEKGKSYRYATSSASGETGKADRFSHPSASGETGKADRFSHPSAFAKTERATAARAPPSLQKKEKLTAIRPPPPFGKRRDVPSRFCALPLRRGDSRSPRTLPYPHGKKTPPATHPFGGGAGGCFSLFFILSDGRARFTFRRDRLRSPSRNRRVFRSYDSSRQAPPSPPPPQGRSSAP